MIFSESLGYLHNKTRWTNKLHPHKTKQTRRFFPTYGWRKCSKSQALKTETELSGSPLWGLQACCCIIPSCWRALCCRSCWSTYLRRDIPTPLSFEEASSSPRLFRAVWICPCIASRRQRKWREIVWSARDVYGLAAPDPAITSKEDTTICIWW